MKHVRATGLAAFAAGLLLSTSLALAVETNIKNLPDAGNVTVNGTVERVNNAQEFRLRDQSGAINIKLAAGNTPPKQGDNVTVNGAVEKRLWGLMGRDIAASSIQVNRGSAANTMPAPSTSTTGEMTTGQNVDAGPQGTAIEGKDLPQQQEPVAPQQNSAAATTSNPNKASD